MKLKEVLFRNKGTGVFLLDFSVFARFNEETLSVMRKVYFGDEAGVGDATGIPKGIVANVPFDVSMDAALAEMEMVIYQVAETAMQASNIKPSEVDILITATDTYVPVPSMSAMIANRFGMRTDLRTYSLAGHACTSGVIAVELAQQLLKARAAKGKVALVVLHESCTAGFSGSNDKACAAANVLFRLNGAALVLSNRSKDRRRAKYELMHTERTLLATDKAFNSIKVRQASDGETGVFLHKEDLLAAAGKTIKLTLTKLAPRILPLSELFRAAWNKDYKPDLARAFDHILIHTGAAAVITAVVKGLQLDPKAAVPSSEALERFGNTTMCSTYYILANIESQGGIKKGDRILQLGFGSGFKCGAAFWRARRTVKDAKHKAWEPYT
ncbi:thiolase-like protein [Coccomyxa subellipsoidea C-169]|uniref:very-long-chain 3-oxoacyl-CoA synthase n=1 Tax=Coccomyxa subellipsoidea (strain C-169) TaxID=574566 RepID=I0YPF2_COCSC|nr:thiolase-like protein [Coccomyxa subellipsoidea C-169]EIE20271.1 thiolase-like protein [Coccomyxa subellipsoidea C-169]|eukprot:XP_005644815.1 thiolase-like protein [Coccomyxa subellipsoidea C-169]